MEEHLRLAAGRGAALPPAAVDPTWLVPLTDHLNRFSELLRDGFLLPVHFFALLKGTNWSSAFIYFSIAPSNPLSSSFLEAHFPLIIWRFSLYAISTLCPLT